MRTPLQRGGSPCRGDKERWRSLRLEGPPQPLSVQAFSRRQGYGSRAVVRKRAPLNAPRQNRASGARFVGIRHVHGHRQLTRATKEETVCFFFPARRSSSKSMVCESARLIQGGKAESESEFQILTQTGVTPHTSLVAWCHTNEFQMVRHLRGGYAFYVPVRYL